MIGEIIWISF